VAGGPFCGRGEGKEAPKPLSLQFRGPCLVFKVPDAKGRKEKRGNPNGRKEKKKEANLIVEQVRHRGSLMTPGSQGIFIGGGMGVGSGENRGTRGDVMYVACLRHIW